MMIIDPYRFASGGGGGGGGSGDGGPSVWGDENGTWDTASTDVQIGHQFTISGSANIDVAALRLYHGTGTITETVRIWDTTDSSLVASASVTATDGWDETSITPVTLIAGRAYRITGRASGSTRTVYRDPTRRQFDGAITYDGGYLVSGTGYPTSSTSAEYTAVSFRSSIVNSGYRFYRVTVTENNGGAYTGTSTIAYATSVGGSDVVQTVGGSSFSTPAATTIDDAFNADTRSGAYWSVALPGTIYWDFGSSQEQDIAEYTIGAWFTSSSTDARSFNSWTLEGSNDYDTWTTLDTVSAQTGWVLDELRKYAI